MYEMLTGKVPFDADTAVSIALKHMQEEAKPPIEVNPNVPVAVNDIIMKALRKDTNLRYQNATAMLLDLKRALKEPNGDFVDNNDYQDFPTQRISTIGLEEERSAKSTNAKNNKKPNKFAQFIKNHKVLSSIVGLILLFVITLGLTIGISNARRPKEVAIPNLVGKTVDEAKQILTENKLNYVEDSSEYNTTYPAGQIISQTPNFVDGRKIKQNTDVKVVVSLGTETTTVPKLKGLTKDEAEDAAKSAKIKLEFVDEISKTIEAGVIIKQEKDEGETVNAGDTVKVYVSIGTGIKQVAVVSVLNEDEATAKKTLEDLGFKVDVKYSKDKSETNGVVLNQSINSGTTVDEGTTITLTVNKYDEDKECQITANISSLTGYVKKKDEDGKEIEAEQVTVVVYIDEKEYNAKPTKRDNEKYSTTIKAAGTVNIKIVVKDSKGNTLASDTKQSINMNTTSTVEFK